MRTLVVGASGHLGSEVARLASAAGSDVSGTATTAATGWSPLDIRDSSAVHTLIASVRPELIVNAAYRATEWSTCADGAANVALAAAACDARLIHVSSDAVHAGRPTPYGDDEPPTPIYAYGAAKAAAETAVTAITPTAILVRTSLITGSALSCKQTRLALDLARGVRDGALFTDEIRCPLDATDLAAAILELATTDYTGVINVAGPQALSRADLGRLTAATHGLDPAAIRTCTAAEAGLGNRPLDIRLDTTRARALLKTRLRPVSESITGSPAPPQH
ncbi:sugar nucleotide-binding protein [Winogradskya consettensis]|uniref:dTDP-4-dehydrorhamnose reductase n=1 Tax=Winogradskya consettensis TaxID=113560 RepID=A0A919VKA6_9ACTN|nr:sugar nucleotide-binding protein [Actinoplanes consettensis]GIM66365.1 dTDP-4-dehydrorhamnose reductase [Actinoplanes consettensis]